jgi:copper chaperone NosL
VKSLFTLDPDVKVLLPDGSTRQLSDFIWPSALLMLAALVLIISMFLPYWSMKMTAPQYPKGLRVNVYINHLEGDMREIDELNHYLGMPELDKGGQLERSISFIAIGVFGLLLIAGVFIHNQWAAILALPVIAYPIVFVADLWYILYQYGHSIDPKSALGSAIKPFTPPIVGEGKVGQFGTIASFEIGFYLALASVVIVLIGLWFHRAAYKPLADARKRVREGKA